MEALHLSFFSECVRLYPGKDAEMKMFSEPSRNAGPLEKTDV